MYEICSFGCEWRGMTPPRLSLPAASRSQNIGRDGGYYARPELFDQTQSASFRKHRDPLEYKLIGETHG